MVQPLSSLPLFLSERNWSVLNVVVMTNESMKAWSTTVDESTGDKKRHGPLHQR